MHTMSAALMADYLRRGLLPVAGAFSYLIAMPWLGYSLLRWQGLDLPLEVLREAPLPISLLFVSLLAGLSVVWFAQDYRIGAGTRLYVLPMPTWFLVLCRMVQCGLTMALVLAVTVACYNAMFGTSWPVLGPVVAMVVLAWWVQAFLWTMLHFRLWKLVSMLAVIGSWIYLLVVWWNDHVGRGVDLGSPPFAVGVLLAVCYAVAAFLVGLEGVARHRRGDCESFYVWMGRLERWWEALFARRAGEFRTPAEALLWMEWSRRGVVLPVFMACLHLGILLVGAALVIFDRTQPLEILKVQLGMAVLFQPQLALLMGMLFGRRNVCSTRWEYDSFNATRPVDDATLTAAFLRSTLRALICSYAVSLAFCLVTAGWTAWQEGFGRIDPLMEHAMGHDGPLVTLAASLLAAWTALGLGGTVALAGRSRLVVWTFAGPASLLAVWLIVVNFIIPDEHAPLVKAVSAGIFGLACLAAAVYSFVRAARKRLVSVAATAWSLVGWLALCGLAALVVSVSTASQPQTWTLLQWLALPLVPGLCALVVLPLASAPLALSWNRHR